MDRAEAVMDRTEKKVEKSKGRARNIQDRSKAWDDLNKQVLAKKAKDAQEQEENWEDVDGGDEKVKIHTGDEEIEMDEVPEATPVPTDVAISGTAPDNTEEDLIL